MHLYQTCLDGKFKNRNFFDDVKVSEITPKIFNLNSLDSRKILVITSQNTEFVKYLTTLVKNGGQLTIPNRTQYDNYEDPNIYEYGDRGSLEE